MRVASHVIAHVYTLFVSIPLLQLFVVVRSCMNARQGANMDFDSVYTVIEYIDTHANT